MLTCVVQYVYQPHDISGLVIWSGCCFYTHCTSSNVPTYNNATVLRSTSKGYINADNSAIHLFCDSL